MCHKNHHVLCKDSRVCQTLGVPCPFPPRVIIMLFPLLEMLLLSLVLSSQLLPWITDTGSSSFFKDITVSRKPSLLAHAATQPCCVRYLLYGVYDHTPQDLIILHHNCLCASLSVLLAICLF